MGGDAGETSVDAVALDPISEEVDEEKEFARVEEQLNRSSKNS